MPYAWSMRVLRAALPLAAALAFVPRGASAQPKGPAGRGEPKPMVLEKEQLGTSAFAGAARARMRSGDCAGALDSFDAAILHDVDPTLRRDRGICHEQLGHPYPAMDDYRAYLTADPDAPDADGIRARLERLEEQTTGKSSKPDADDKPAADTTSGSASASITVGSGGVSGSTDSSSSGGGAPRHETMDYVDRDSEPMQSSLRHGKGWSFGPYFLVHKWFFDNSTFGQSDTWSEGVGLQFRYAFGALTTLFLEGAYQKFNSSASSTDTAQGDVQGLTSQLGLELRFPLDLEYDNQLIVAPGLGFDHIVASGNSASSTSVSAGALVPRARVGWRHMFTPSTGMDLSLDLGYAKFATYDNGDFPFNGNGAKGPLVALNFALLWGL